MDYAYLDKYGILHVVDTKELAEEFASGKIVETNIANGGGYPIADGKHVIVYTQKGEYKVNGTTHPIDKLSEKYPQVAALVNELK